MSKLRWGILGTANIVRKNWRAIRDSGNSTITAVASRDAARARQFIAECQREVGFDTAPAALGSYEELLASKNVDAVYIPLPTGIRKEWVIRAAQAGKHVLCEKPCGPSLADVQEMTDACKKNRVQFMDGVMFMHNPRMPRIHEALHDKKTFGEIRRFMSVFTFATDEDFYDANIRVHSTLEPAGCLGDLGWYCIRFALWAMGWQMPKEITGRVLAARGNRLSPGAPPTDFSAELIFDNDISMGFYCGFRAHYQHWVHVGGTKGALRLPDFVHPTSVDTPSFELNGKQVFVVAGENAIPQEALMIRNFANQVATGKLNDEWPMWALKTQQVTDACLAAAQ